MIHSFACKNFYSFGEEVNVSFKVNNNAPKNNGYFTTSSGNRLSKVATVIGPNASGKTNLLKVLPFIKWLIVDSFNTKPESPIIFQPFIFGKFKNKPTSLSVVFEITGKVYAYDFIINQKRILQEELKVTSFMKKKKSTKKLFVRVWQEKENRYDFMGSNFALPAKNFEDLLRANASVIGTAARLNHKESQAIIRYWEQVKTNVVEAGYVGDHLLPNAIIALFEALSFFEENGSLKAEAEKLLRGFDLGLSKLDIGKEKKEDGFSLNVQMAHLFNKEEQYLPIQYESSGTKQLLILLKPILAALAEGGIVVIDELDVNLHPEIVIALYNLFIHPETNPKNVQLFMSTHVHLLLNKLDKSQIILVEKNEKGMSEVWRLDEVSDIRSDENYYTKYITGAYGAFPRV